MLRIPWLARLLNKLAGPAQGIGDGLQARRRRCYEAINHSLDIRQSNAQQIAELVARIVRLLHPALIRDHRPPALRSGFAGTEPNFIASERPALSLSDIAGSRLPLLEHAPDATVIVDSDGCIQLVNAQTERLFGYYREELIGKPVEMLIPARYHRRHVSRVRPITPIRGFVQWVSDSSFTVYVRMAASFPWRSA